MNSPKLTGLGIHEQTILTLTTFPPPAPSGQTTSITFLYVSWESGSGLTVPYRGEFLAVNIIKAPSGSKAFCSCLR